MSKIRQSKKFGSQLRHSTQRFNQRGRTKPSKLSADYIVGLTDGEGSFTIYLNPPNKRHGSVNYRVQCRYYIKMREDELPLLEKVKLLIIKKLWSLALIVDIKKSKKIVAISQESKKVIVNRFKISPEEITVIPPGVKTDIYKPIPSIRKRKNKNIFRLFYCGRLCLRKGTDLLLDSLVLLKEKYKIQNSKLYIAGTVDKNFNLKREVKKRHLERNVFFLGNLSDQELSLHYNLSDVFVFPSRIEGYGIPPLEALACGIKVVSTNIPSIKPFQEIIIVKTTAKSIAEGILRAIDKSIDFKLARRKIEKDYSVGVVSKKYIELYKGLILK